MKFTNIKEGDILVPDGTRKQNNYLSLKDPSLKLKVEVVRGWGIRCSIQNGKICDASRGWNNWKHKNDVVEFYKPDGLKPSHESKNYDIF